MTFKTISLYANKAMFIQEKIFLFHNHDMNSVNSITKHKKMSLLFRGKIKYYEI